MRRPVLSCGVAAIWCGYLSLMGYAGVRLSRMRGRVVTDLTVRVSGGWGSEYPGMSPGLRARIAQSDAEHARAAAAQEQARRVAAEAAYERAVLAAAQEKAAAEGLPLNVAMRTVGRTRAEAVAYYSALGDIQDARQEAQQARQLRQLAANAGLIDVSEAVPPERMVQTAARMAPRDEPPEVTGRGVRSRWLRASYRRME
jgi:hypothetical protein